MSEITCAFTPTHPMHLATDAESKRYAIGGVAVEPLPDGQVVCAATNSRILAVVKEEGTATEPHIIHGSAFKAKKGQSLHVVKNGQAERHSWTEKRGVMTDKTVSVLPEVEGRFPRFRDVLPNIDGHFAVTIDARYLLDLAAAIGRSDEITGITLFVPIDGDDPTEASDHGGIGCVVQGGGIGAIMPLCGHEQGEKPNHNRARAEYREFVKSISVNP